MTTKSAAAMLPNALPIPAPPPAFSFSILAVAKKFTVPPMYDAHRQPARRAVASLAYGIAMKENDATHPITEPILPAKNGSVIPRTALLIAVDLDIVEFVASLYVVSSGTLDVGAGVEDEDRSANTRDAGKNTPQHQSYRKWSVGTVKINEYLLRDIT